MKLIDLPTQEDAPNGIDGAGHRTGETGGPERLVLAEDAGAGLRSVIAIHSTARGPAAGGCRVYPYADTASAVADAKRLAHGMSMKNALAGLPLGGGKAVIIADPARDKTDAMMRAFGEAVEALGGAYVTGEDVGVSVADMDAVKQVTPYVMGASDAEGDPSTHTARGVFLCMARAAALKWGGDLDGVRVAIKGVGHVGAALARMLHAAGARLLVADARAQTASSLAAELGAHTVAPHRILTAQADILAPCALGADLSAHTIPDIQARIVCGAANNQLATPQDDARLRAAGIIYCPDYLVNAGGIIAISRGVTSWSAAKASTAIEALPESLQKVLDRAEAERQPTGAVADAMARARLGAAQSVS
ncbi:MAG: Glu/Leu/Phe/Val dehydrogenase dimerization domain-containing protein [Pseudomonadota bacterium]